MAKEVDGCPQEHDPMAKENDSLAKEQDPLAQEQDSCPLHIDGFTKLCRVTAKGTARNTLMKGSTMQKFLTGSERLQRSDTILTNILSTPAIADEVNNLGITTDRLKSGLDLVREVTELNSVQQAEYADQYQASEDFTKAFAKCFKTYMRYIKIARIAFNDNTDARVSMRLDGERKQVYNGWLDQANDFYTNLLKSEEFLKAVSVYGLNEKSLIADYQEVKDLAALSSQHQKEKGEAVSATKTRDEKMMELDKFIGELTKICKIAFEDTPENLKLIGISK